MQGPGCILCCRIQEMDVIVAVVHHINLEARCGHLFGCKGHESQIAGKLVASFALFNRGLEGHFTVNIHQRIGRWYRLLFIQSFGHHRLDTFAFRNRLTTLFHLRRNHLRCTVVVTAAYQYHIMNWSGNLETVSIFYQHDIFAFESCNSATTCRTQKIHFIAYFHCCSILKGCYIS